MQRARKPRKVNKMQKKTSSPRKKPATSSKSRIGNGLIKIGAGIADGFLPGAGSIVRGIGSLAGFGAYTRKGAEAYLASRVPAMHSTIDTGVRIAHHEYLGEMTSSVAFTLYSYAINPGLPGAFPWLSTIAAAFQKWEDHGIVFYFKSTSAIALNSTNTALGTVIGAVTYNPYQVAPTDKVTMLALAGVQTGKPAEDNLFPVECKMSQSLFGTKLVRTGHVADDLAKYDAGNFHLATIGSQAAAQIGELHVCYDITLKEPKLSPSGWCSHAEAKYDNNLAILETVGVSPWWCNPIGVEVYGVGVTSGITFPAFAGSVNSKYKIDLYWIGAVGAAISYPVVSFVNCAYFTGLCDGAGDFGDGHHEVPVAGVNVTRCHQTIFLSITDPKSLATVILTGGGACTLPATPSAVHIFVTELDSQVL